MPWVTKGFGSIAAATGRAARLRWRALAQGLETVIKEVSTGTPIAWFPMELRYTMPSPGGPSWAGSAGNHLYIIKLEGAEMLSLSKEQLESLPAAPIREKRPWWKFW